jgi:DMSO reductase anchor subunit
MVFHTNDYSFAVASLSAIGSSDFSREIVTGQII